MAVLVAATAVLGACGSTARVAPPSSRAAAVDAAVRALGRAHSFHVVYVDGDHARTFDATVSPPGDAEGTLLVAGQGFPFRIVAAQVLLRSPQGGSWVLVGPADAAPYLSLLGDVAALAACVDGAGSALVDRGTATVDGQRARRLHASSGVISADVDVSTSAPSHLVRFVQHQPHAGAPPAGCPGGEIVADVSDVRAAPAG
jgi:hypothetical protein